MSSLASLLAQWFTPPAARPAPPASPPAASEPRADEREYPFRSRGLPAVDAAEVIAPHAVWLRRLGDAYGADQATFDRDIRSVVERYAQYVHLLPATPESYFRHAGGLFRMGLEVGFYALQATDGAIFSPRQTITVRSTLEPRWRYATFLAGLCSQLHRTLNHLSVRNDRGAEWPAYIRPLAPWLRDTNSARYYVRWVHDPATTPALSILAMAHVVAPSTLQYLAEGNSVVVPQCIAAISGGLPQHEGNTLERLVRRSCALVVEQELRRDSARLEARDGHGESAPQEAAADGEFTPQGAGPADAQSRSPRRATPPLRLALVAPARLHPAVRDALRQIIDSLDSPSQPAAVITEAGVFVPLHAFERRGVDPVLAVRALSDARMLAVAADAPQSRTCLRQVDNEQVLGVVLAQRCVSGPDARVCGAEER